MPSPQKGSKSPARRPSRSRKAAVPHVIDYEPESPVIRQQEAEMARRKGYRNALWLIIAITVVALGKLVWEEAFEKNARFLLKALDVQTSGPLSVPKLVGATALTLETNLLTLNLGEVRSRLERLPQVKGVHIQRDYNGSYVQFIRAQSAATRKHLLGLPWSDAQAARYATMALESLAEQQRIEAADTMPFEQYRQAYLSPERLQVKRVQGTPA